MITGGKFRGFCRNKKVAPALSFFASYPLETNRLTTKLLTALPHETLSEEGKTTTFTASLLNYRLLLFMASVKFFLRRGGLKETTALKFRRERFFRASPPRKLDKELPVVDNRVVKKVLIVENSRPLLEQEQSILSNRNLQVFTAASGQEALVIHKNEKVDLIVSRLDMPGTSGDSLCSLVRNDDTLKKVSFIMVCDNTPGDLERCQKCGANSYVIRPVDPAVLLEKASQLISIPQRTGIRVLIKVSVRSDIKNQPFFCTSVNISTSGILLEVDKAAPGGEILTCSFFIPGSDSIAAHGEIMRMGEVSPGTYHWGVKFIDLLPDHKTAIEAFVKKKT